MLHVVNLFSFVLVSLVVFFEFHSSFDICLQFIHGTGNEIFVFFAGLTTQFVVSHSRIRSNDAAEVGIGVVNVKIFMNESSRTNKRRADGRGNEFFAHVNEFYEGIIERRTQLCQQRCRLTSNYCLFYFLPAPLAASCVCACEQRLTNTVIEGLKP